MTLDEKKLIENVLDGLDKLFDRDYDVRDIHALIFATAIALKDTKYSFHLEKATRALEVIIDTDKDDSVGINVVLALNVTDELRHFLADNLD